MTRDELLAAVIAERNDYRWFATPPKQPLAARDIAVARDDDLTTARRRRALVESADIHRAAS